MIASLLLTGFGAETPVVSSLSSIEAGVDRAGAFVGGASAPDFGLAEAGTKVGTLGFS